MQEKESKERKSLRNCEREPKNSGSRQCNAAIDLFATCETRLEGTFDCIVRDKPIAASNRIDAIEEKCKLLAVTPEFGEKRPEFGANIRQQCGWSLRHILPTNRQRHRSRANGCR